MQYRLVISDIKMPVMDGFEFVKRVKEIKPEVKVFFMTAYEIDDMKFSSTKIDEVITKPISASVLGNAMKEGWGEERSILKIEGKVTIWVPTTMG